MNNRLLVVLCLLFAGCYKKPINEFSTNNPEVRVFLLAEHDGIKIYFFKDEERRIYFTDARGETMWAQSQGKHSQEVEVQTIK